MMIKRRERLRRRGSRIVHRVLRSYRQAQRGRPGRTLVSRRQRMGRETLRTEHRRTVAVAHRRSVKMILRMISLVKARLILVPGRHTLYNPVAERVRRCHPLLLLPPVTEPHPHHLFLQLKAVRQRGDLLRGRFRLFVKVLLKRALHRHLDRRTLLPFPALGGDLVDAGRRAGRRVRLLEPLLQQRLQLAHVLEAQLESLEPAYRRLREDVAVESTERETDVRLGETELDAPLFELSGERLEVVRGRCVLLAGALIPVVRVARVQRVADRRAGIPQVRMQTAAALMIVQLRMMMRVRMQHPVHRVYRVVLLKGRGRCRATARIVVGRRDDRRVPRMRRGHPRRLVRTAMRMHRLIVGGRGCRRRGCCRRCQRFHVQSSVRLVRMMVRMMTGMVHRHRGGPVVATRLHAQPRIRRREARRWMGQSIRRRRRGHLVMVMMVVMMLRRRHVLHLASISGAARWARGIATHGDVHPDRGTRTIQLGRHCGTNRHVRGSGHLPPLVQRCRETLSLFFRSLPRLFSLFSFFLSSIHRLFPSISNFPPFPLSPLLWVYRSTITFRGTLPSQGSTLSSPSFPPFLLFPSCLSDSSRS